LLRHGPMRLCEPVDASCDLTRFEKPMIWSTTSGMAGSSFDGGTVVSIARRTSDSAMTCACAPLTAGATGVSGDQAWPQSVQQSVEWVVPERRRESRTVGRAGAERRGRPSGPP
jgi:hypothetical protein